MTLREAYEKLNGDYDDLLRRVPESLVEHLLLESFPKDPNMAKLREAVDAGDIEGSFEACHTLKGNTSNMSFTGLHDAVWALTEQLRPLSEPADPELFARVEEAYNLIMDTIEEYKAEK